MIVRVKKWMRQADLFLEALEQLRCG